MIKLVFLDVLLYLADIILRIQSSMKLRQLNRQDLDSLSISFAEAFAYQGFSHVSSLAYLEKKYRAYISGENLPTWCYMSNTQEIACSYSVLTVPYLKNGAVNKVGLVCDVLTKPNYQQLGLFRKLGKEVKGVLSQEGIDYTIGFPVRGSITAQHLKVGWEHLFDMPLWAIPSFSLKSHSKLIEVKTLNDEFDFTKIKLGGSGNLAISSSALHSRFARIDCVYKILKVVDSSQFAIVREAKVGKIRFLAIIHIQFDELDTGRLIISSIMNLALKSGIFAAIGCWNDSFSRELQLKKLGLLKTSKVQNFIAREINSPILKNDGDYRLSWLDTDAL